MRIIITVNGGLVQSVFTDSDDVSVDILDYDCFNDWDIPNIYEIDAYVHAYISEYQFLPYEAIWSSQRDLYFEEGESGTFLFTSNGGIWEDKQIPHWVVAVRKY